MQEKPHPSSHLYWKFPPAVLSDRGSVETFPNSMLGLDLQDRNEAGKREDKVFFMPHQTGGAGDKEMGEVRVAWQGQVSTVAIHCLDRSLEAQLSVQKPAGVCRDKEEFNSE